jgi:Flp pilus assembly protein TadG
MKQTKRRERGQSLVEFALVLPVLATIVFILLDFGRVVTTQNEITNGAREGARLGSVGTYDFADQSSWLQRYTDIRNRVRAASPGITIADSEIKGAAGACIFPLPVDPATPTYCFFPNFNAADPTTYVYVTVHKDVTLLTPLIDRIVGNPISVDGTSRVTVRS